MLGSNRGASVRIFDAAIEALPRLGVAVCQVSPRRLTRPVGASGRRRYLNCAVVGETELLPQTLMRRLLRLERELGRRRHGRQRRKLPRTLDVDLLACGKLSLHMPTLTLPHPRLAGRRFVLQALVDVDPKLRLHGCEYSVRKLLRRLG